MIVRRLLLGLEQVVFMNMFECKWVFATIQRLMDACLADANFDILLIDLDDILVFSPTIEEHLSRLEFVFGRLREHGLKKKQSKYNFFQREVKNLGHVVSEQAVKRDLDKSKLKREWSTPSTE